MRDEKFSMAVMNKSKPSASDVAAFEDDLRGHRVKVMLYNAQASEPAVQRLMQIAKEQNIPVVGSLGDGTARQDLPGMDDRATRRSRQGARQSRPVISRLCEFEWKQE